jgi:hypothetical protein
MKLTGRASHAESTRHERSLPNGFRFHRSEWMEGGRDARLSPTVFLVEQPPGSELQPHFHEQNQFQLVQRGSGRIGVHPIAQGSLHYAGAFTGYGPVRAGPEGLSYFTIRSVHETGAKMLPQDRGYMPRGPKRHMQSAPLASVAQAELASLREPRCVTVFAAQPDGLAAACWFLPPGAPAAVAGAAGAGQFFFVVAGALLHAGETFSGWESLYFSQEEPTPELRAGPSGLQLFVLQMPQKAQAYAV